jgi:hypothetical protein
MAKVTITVPDDLRRARVRTAREQTSVNNVLRAQLAGYVDDDVEAGQAWDHFLKIAARASGRSFSGRRRWYRDELQRDTRSYTR